MKKLFGKVSESPTNPRAEPAPRAFDVADFYRGPLAGGAAVILARTELTK